MGTFWRRLNQLFGHTVWVVVALFVATSAAAETEIRAAYPWTPDTLDPAKMKLGGSEYNFAYLVYNGLTTFNNDLTVRGDLAESWEANEDVTVWTFHLREGARFHHGRPVEALDVIASLERILDPETGSIARASFEVVQNMEAVDDRTVRFTLAQPYSDFPAVLAANQAKILPRDGLDSITTKPTGTGPFQFVEYRPGDRIVMAKNPDYWEPDLPKADRVVFMIIPEYASAVAALEAGDVHLVWQIPPEHADRLQTSATARADVVPSGSWYAIAFNTAMAPFDNVEVRRAMSLLIDKRAITDIASFGYGTPTHTPIPPYHVFYNDDVPLSSADPAAARQALADAGFPDGLELTYWYPKDTAYLERTGVAFRDVAKQAGVTINLNPVPDDKFYAEVEGQQPLFGTSFFGRTTPDTMTYAWYHSSGSWNENLWKYKNEEVDRILDEARSVRSDEKRKELYRRFQEILVDDGPGQPVFVANHANGVHNSVQGFASSPVLWFDLKAVALAE